MDDLAISVICTDNRPALESCLEALPDAADGLSWRATVVDNACTDGTGDMVRDRFPWANVIRNEVRRGFSANHNLTLVPALAQSSARYVLILNDDTILDPRALTTMVTTMDETPDIGALGPSMRGLDGARQVSLLSFPTPMSIVYHSLRPGRPVGLPDEEARWLNGSCVLLRPEALREAGTLDEQFFIFFEDTDLGLRLRNAGWASTVDGEAGMVHLEHSTVSMPALNSPMARQMLRSQWLYVRKHHGPVRAAIVATLVRGCLVARAVKACALGWLQGNEHERGNARHFLTLARYRVSKPLAHESGR
jgi:N-acetylglucosaminyl-diphospho-decaprenol L-rhamnosyltransferase